MKRIPILLMTVMVILVITVAPQAGAKSRKKDDETDSRAAKVQRLDRMPTMGFYSGTLNELTGGRWELDGAPLGFAADCTVAEAGSDDVQLRSGLSVVLMGQKVGDGILVRRVLVQKPDHVYDSLVPANPSVIWSESDPTVGEGGPPES